MQSWLRKMDRNYRNRKFRRGIAPKVQAGRKWDVTALVVGQGRGIHGDAVDIADVVLFVQNWTDRPVVDKTGLTELYSI